jgi:ATP-dependent DNA ligase
LPDGSAIISVPSRLRVGDASFSNSCAPTTSKGIVAKRLADPYESRVRWLKIKNRHYSQAENRGELFNGRASS